MNYLSYCLLFITLFAACKKDSTAIKNASKVDIYLLKTFSINVDQTTTPSTLSLSNSILADTPLIADKDIELYTQLSTTFKFAKNIKSLIQNYGGDKAFAVTVDNQPVYFGIFHPAYLSSIAYGLATIDPIIYTTNNEISIQYATLTGNTYLLQFDRRNDDKIINALKTTGRVR
jgi:hypothetical protein